MPDGGCHPALHEMPAGQACGKDKSKKIPKRQRPHDATVHPASLLFLKIRETECKAA